MSDIDNAVLAFAEDIMNDKPSAEPIATNEVAVEQPQVVEPPVTKEVTEDAPIEFVISDTPTDTAQVKEVVATEKTDSSVDDFDKKYQERIAQDLGVDLDTLKSKLAQFTELEAKASSNVYKSEQGRIFDDLVSKGVPIETINAIAFRDLSNADDLQVLDYQMQLKYPKATAEQRMAYLEETYKQGEDYLDREKQSGGFKLMQDAENARKELDSLKITALQNPAEKQQAEFAKVEEARVKAWENGLSKKAIESFNSLERKVKLNLSFDGKPVDREAIVKIPITSKDKAEMEALISANIPYWQNATADAKGQEFIKDILHNHYVVNNLDKIVQGAVNNALSFAVEQQKNYLHNYQAPRNNQAPPANGATLNQSDKQIVDGLYDVLNS